MLAHDESLIKTKVQATLEVQYLRAKVEQAEAELEQVHLALSQLPSSYRADLLAKQEGALEALHQKETEVLVQARTRAKSELQAEHVESLRIEAMPLLERAAKNLEFVRESLRKVVNIKAEARENGGRVMSEGLDTSSIAFFVPQLVYQPERRTWLLKRT
jgi:hypothetical protein